MSAWPKLGRLGARAWRWLRSVTGDDAYETYVSRAGGSARPPTREEFYLDGLRRRYSRINRCC